MLNYSMNFQHYFFYHLLWFKKIVLVYRWVLAMFALSKYDNQQILKNKQTKKKKVQYSYSVFTKQTGNT